jgi:hypothetical protein
VCVVCRLTACWSVLGASCSANEVLGPRRRGPAHCLMDMTAQTKWKCVHECNHLSNKLGQHCVSRGVHEKHSGCRYNLNRQQPSVGMRKQPINTQVFVSNCQGGGRASSVVHVLNCYSADPVSLLPISFQ